MEHVFYNLTRNKWNEIILQFYNFGSQFLISYRIFVLEIFGIAARSVIL